MLSHGLLGWKRWRLAVLAVTGLAGVIASVAAYWGLRVREYRLTEASFRLDAEQRAGAIHRQFATNLDVVRALMAFYRGSQEVERPEFSSFVQPFLESHAGIEAFGWAPLVRRDQREAHQQRARQEGLRDYRITQRAPTGELTAAGADRAECFPVFFLAPQRSSALALGFDLGSVGAALAAIERARATGELAVATRFPVPDISAPRSILVFAPIYRKGPSATTPAERFARLEGVVLAVVQVGAIIEDSLDDSTDLGIDFQLFDRSSPDSEELLYTKLSRLRYRPFVVMRDPVERALGGISHQVGLTVADREWSIFCTPTDAYLAHRATWLPVAMLVCGLLITVLVVGFAGLLLGQTQQVERLVVQKTHELRETNERLAREVAERQRSEQELRNSESLYVSLVETLPVYVLRKDLEGRFTFANQAFCALLGKPQDEIVGKTDYDFYPPELAEKYRRDDVQVAQTGQLFECIEQNRKDGETRYVQVMKSPVRNASGEVVGTQVIFWDVTERTRAQEQLEKAKEEAEAANRAKSSFLANMSHEIRTPLNAVLGMTELLLDTRLSPEQRDYLLMIRESGESLLSLVSDILDFSKIDAGKLELDCAPFDLQEMLGDTLRAMAVRAHYKGLELACQMRRGVPIMVVGDATRLRQIIVNLVGNAVKFTDRGEVVVEVDCRSRWGDEVLLHFGVSDSGVGIPEDKRSIIFEAFEQVDTSMSRRCGGSGLGLAISSRLVELLGGRMWLESEPGQGSTFHFTTKLTVLPGEPAEPSVPAAALCGLRVLVIDDNATSREILEEMLISWDMRPVAASSAPEGLQLLRQARESGDPIGLVLADARMPGMSGFELAERIRQDPASNVRLIMLLTSGDRPADVARCEQLGASAYVLKPVKQSELFDAIAVAMGIASIEEEQVPSSAGRPFLRRLRILLAEDSLVNQKLVTALLERQGHEVTAVNNGKEALALVQAQRFDLVFMDLQMPEMDGLEATRLIRAAEKGTGRHLPIVAMTAHALKGDRERCLAAGMDEYLAKPIRAKRLLETIEALLGTPASPAAPEPPADLPGLETACDWAAALSAVKGDRELLRMVVEAFLEESPQLISAMRHAIEQRDGVGLRRVAHTLKGSVNYFGATELFQHAFQLEKLGQDGNFQQAPELFHLLENEWHQLTSVLRQYAGGNLAGSPR